MNKKMHDASVPKVSDYGAGILSLRHYPNLNAVQMGANGICTTKYPKETRKG